MQISRLLVIGQGDARGFGFAKGWILYRDDESRGSDRAVRMI